MARSFIQDPDSPEGMGRVVDPDTGLDRVVYDPELARQLGSTGGGYQPEPLRTLAPGEHLAAPPVPSEEPDPAVDEGVQRWQSANGPRSPAPIVRASGAAPPVRMPEGIDPALQQSKVTIKGGEPGTPYDKAAEEQRGADLAERTIEQQRRADEVDVIKNEQQIELTTQKNEAAKRESEERARAKRFETELDTVVNREINQDRLQENSGFFGSILGLVGKTLGYLATPESGFGRLQADLDRRVQRDIDAQKEAKDSMVGHLTKKLGSAQQAENHYRAQVNSMTANIFENRLQRLGLQNQYADEIQKLRDTAMAYNEAAKAASYGKPGAVEVTLERPKPTGGTGGVAPSDPELKALGFKTPEDYTKGMQQKIVAGESSPTIGQGVDMVTRMDGDLNALNHLAAENGGTLPTTGLIRIPKVAVGPLSKLGIKDGMKAEEVDQLLNEYIVQQARQMGGVITENDLKFTENISGQSTAAKLRWIERQRERMNEGLSTAANVAFPGQGRPQKVLDYLLRGRSSTTGVQNTNPKPAVRTDPPKAAAPEREKSDVEKRQAENRKKARASLGDFFSDLGKSLPQPPRYGGAK